jgi:aspartate/methionine/tyrosine aminotransferase
MKLGGLSTMSDSTWANRIKAQPMFDVLELANAQASKGKYVARMEIGDTPGFKNESIHNLLEEAAQEPHRYSPSPGEPQLIEQVFASQWKEYSQSKYDVCIAPANFLITAALIASTSPGDLVLLPNPGFPTYKLACDFLGLRVTYYDLYPSSDNKFPNLRKHFTYKGDNPKVIIVNNPSNPLGIAYFGHDVSSKLHHDSLQVILDETYNNLVYDQVKPEVEFEEAIRIRSFSKEHCAPGIRIGYLLAPKSKAKIIADFISLTISCSPKFIQLAVAKYLASENCAEFTAKIRQEMTKRIDFLMQRVPPEMILSKPNSAFYAVIQTGGGENCFEFLMSRNVSTCPGLKFGTATRDTVRISLAGTEDNFEKDISMLSSALQEYQSMSQK